MITWTPGELELFGAKETCSVSEFAARYRPVTLGAHLGSWDNTLVPYLTEIMDTAGLPYVEEMVICGPPQSGKTNACLNILLHHIYRYGGNGKYCMFPTEQLAKLFVNMRLKPVLERSPALSCRMGGKSATTLERIAMTDGTFIFPAWGTSAAKLSSFGADFVWADEVDKNADLVGDESDPLTLLEDRVRTFRRRKMLKCSTPTVETGLIWQALGRCADVREYHVACPHCDTLQQMKVEQLTWPGQLGLFETAGEGRKVNGENCQQPDQDPELLKSLRPARYACESCGSLWDDLDRNIAVRRGRWLSRQQRPARPRSVGFHISGFLSPDISLSDIAAAICAARGGDIALERRRDNSILGIPWKETRQAAVTEAALMKYKSELPRNLVPPDTAALWLLVDTQQDSFYYQLWSCSYAPEMHLHLINHGILKEFMDLEGMLKTTWEDHEGKQYRISSGLIDSGGTRRSWQKHSRTIEVYEWCSRNRVMIPHKGMHGRAGDIISYKTIATWPGSNKAIPGGLTRANLRVDQFKDELERLLTLDPESPSALSLHCDVDEAFAKHYTTERKDEHGDWQHEKKLGRNDYFDCTVYALALREMLKLRPEMRRPSQKQQQAARTDVRQQQTPSLPGWYQNRR